MLNTEGERTDPKRLADAHAARVVLASPFLRQAVEGENAACAYSDVESSSEEYFQFVQGVLRRLGKVVDR